MNYAATRNLSLVATAAEQLLNRKSGLPGIACLFGPSGFGKTSAALAVAQETRGFFVQLRSAWPKRAILEKILIEMGVRNPSGTITTMLDAVCTELAQSRRMLIIDEFDYALRSQGILELFRDIYEGSQSTMLILGEELLPQKLAKWERFHSRVLSWIGAQPVSLADAQSLCRIYAPDISIDPALLQTLVDRSGGSVRRVVVNLSNIAEAALTEGWETVGLDQYNAEIYTGESPRRTL